MGTPNTREFDEVLRSLCSPWREELDRLEPGKKAMVSELRFRDRMSGEPDHPGRALVHRSAGASAESSDRDCQQAYPVLKWMNWLPPSVTIRSTPMPRRSGMAISACRVGAGQDFADRLS